MLMVADERRTCTFLPFLVLLTTQNFAELGDSPVVRSIDVMPRAYFKQSRTHATYTKEKNERKKEIIITP